MQVKASLSDTIVPNLSDLLLVTANPRDADLWKRCLEDSGWHGTAEVLTDPAEIHQRCRVQTYHAILLDQSHPKLNPSLTSEILRRLAGHPPVILITDATCETSALEGLASGAFDFVFRSCLSRLPLATQRAVEATDLKLDLEGADDQLQEIEERFQALAESIDEGAAIEGADGMLYTNQALADILQSTSALDLLGKSLLSFISSNQQDALLEKLNASTHTGETVAHDITLSRMDGNVTEAHLSSRPITFHGQPSRLFVVRDRREQRRVEAVISHLANFAQENPNPILLFSADGRMTYHNAAAMELAQSFGREHPSFCVPPQAASIIENCLVSGHRRERVVWEQGNRNFSWSFFPHKESGVVHAFVIEITDQKKLEDQLRHSQRLEGVGRLAGGIAHEYNNLLTVIGGQAQVLSEQENLSPESRSALQQLLHATERAAQITQQLQSFGRRNKVKMGGLQLNSVITKLTELLGKSLGDNIALSLKLDPILPEILADVGLMEQVILNLAVNAKEAMIQGGQLVISTAITEIPSDRSHRHPEARAGRFVRLSLADTGCGMDSRMLPYVFEPFFTTKQSEFGSGLGLSTSYGIVKQHHGWIEVSSQSGLGTSFRVFLPIAPVWALDERDETFGLKSPFACSETVLIVEDDPAVRYTLRSMLLNDGYKVLEAANPLEAMAIWRETRDDITVLLTDLVMPSGMSGQDLACQLSEAKPTLRILYMSGYSVDSLAIGTPLEVGVNFLQKPFTARDVTAALQQGATAVIQE